MFKIRNHKKKSIVQIIVTSRANLSDLEYFKESIENYDRSKKVGLLVTIANFSSNKELQKVVGYIENCIRPLDCLSSITILSDKKWAVTILKITEDQKSGVPIRVFEIEEEALAFKWLSRRKEEPIQTMKDIFQIKD